MKIYNTKTRKIEEFIPHNKDEVTMYTCGPTVYHYAHIGNLRTYIMEDILEKTLKYIGYNVKRVMNITDVGHLSSDADSGDDKMIKSAKEQNKKVMEIADYYTESFFKDFEKLNIYKPEIVSAATDNIDEYIKIIEKLLKTNYAYSSGGNIYFDTSKIDEYYSLTNHTEEDLMIGARDDVEEDKNKKNKTDFVLWFTKSKFDDQDLKWDSPFGEGYPGWHIECSGISMKYLGKNLDIHCGGVDNIFPHHTNEIAQSEAYLGHSWCKYWIHGEHLNDITGKMSKSKGETLTVSTLENKGYDPLAYRFMCLNSHYRKQLIFTYESLDGAANSYQKLKNKINNLPQTGNIDKEIYDKYNNLFIDAISNDMNTANAITIIYDLLKDNVDEYNKYVLIKDFDKVLSLNLTRNDKIKHDKHDYIIQKIEERNQAKKDKNYQLADNIREELSSLNIELLDTREGTTYKIKS